MKLIWATRGRDWGFRFLARGGRSDPLAVYEEVFAGLEGHKEAWRRVGNRVALRFPDPEGRTDAAGRVIPHDFVVLGPPALVDEIDSVETGMREIWPQVAGRFEAVWSDAEPPATEE